MRRKRLYYCAFVFKTYAQQLAIQNCDWEKVSHPCAPIKTKIWKKKKETKIGRNQMDWSKLCSKQGWNFFPHTPRNCEQLANVIQKKKKKNVKTCARKIKKKSQCDTNWLHPSFSEKKRWNKTKTKQEKRTVIRISFCCDSSQWLRPVLAVPTAYI